MDLSNMFDLTKKVGYPEIFSLTLSFLALLVAGLSYWNSLQTKWQSLPAVNVETILEAFDTRKFSEGRIVWYWGLNIANTGGRAITLRGLGPDDRSLPIVVLGKERQLLEIRPNTVAVYIFDGPKFEQLAAGPAAFEQYKPKNMEELGALNIAIPSGESRALQMAIVVETPKGAADMLFFNLKLNFNTGASHSISKFASIKPSK
jgi:hypothetical protein